MQEFTWIDGVVLGVYFLSMASMGPIFAHKSKTTEGYFLGDRAFPGWLLGFSMFATSISSISFMAYPADAYKTAWLRYIPNLALPFTILFASHFFLPFFRRGHITSAYEYLEERFSPNVRLYAAVAFIIGQVIRISLILFLVAQLVETITGLNSIYSALLGGIITCFYTITGGIRAVIWTDFIQAMVLWVGGLICLFVIANHLGGPITGLGEIWRVGMEDGKFALADLVKNDATQTAELVKAPWGFDFTQKTIILMFLMGMGNWIYEYSGNQTVIQRYCASRSPRDARIAMWCCCWFSVPTWALFMFIGTGLYVFYKYHSDPVADASALAMMDAFSNAKPEGILPYFVVKELPPGLSGLVIAAVLAAAMSSISSCINSVSVVSVVDVYKRRMKPNHTDKHYVYIAKMVGIAQGVIMILGAIVLLRMESKTLQDTANEITALTAGGLAGLYLLGFLTIRGNGRAVGVGIVLTLLWTLWMVLSRMGYLDDTPYKAPIDTYYAGLIGHVIMFVVGYVLGLLWPRKEPVKTNHSVWTQDDSPLV